MISDYIAEIEELKDYEPDEIGCSGMMIIYLLFCRDFTEIFFNKHNRWEFCNVEKVLKKIRKNNTI